ncbi:MAG: ECF transporter S component [Oscillospiraceae bacterium]|nr:ECF transporter S component [Oscillospiraceae bacterium]
MKKHLNKMVLTALLSALSTVLMFVLEFPLPLLPNFLKFDFSDFPALIAAFAFGPVAGISVVLVKNLFHLLASTTGFVGELANFTVGTALVLPSGLIYSKKRAFSGALVGMLAGTSIMALAGALFNYFVFFPLFLHAQPMDLILLGVVPFNLVKGIIVSVLTLLVYKHISPLLQKNWLRV